MATDLERSAEILKTICYSGPDFSALDEQGRRIYLRACDLKARFWLNRTAAIQLDEREPIATLVNAEQYLADRLAYELAPWPKGKIKI